MNYKKLMKKFKVLLSALNVLTKYKEKLPESEAKTKGVKDKEEIASNITRKEMNAILVLCTKHTFYF